MPLLHYLSVSINNSALPQKHLFIDLNCHGVILRPWLKTNQLYLYKKTKLALKGLKSEGTLNLKDT